MKLDPIITAKTELQKLPLAEREERGRVILNLSNQGKHSVSFSSLDEFLAELSKSIRFLNACVLIRRNYSEWIRYLANPVRVFQDGALGPILKNNSLVFSIYVMDLMGIIALDPQQKFLRFKNLFRGDNNRLLIQVTSLTDYHVNFPKIMDMWSALDRPTLSSNKEQFERKMDLKQKELAGCNSYNSITMFTLLTDAIDEYNLPFSYQDTTDAKKETPCSLYILGLVEDFSCYMAYEIPGKEGAVRLARELFPEWKTLVDDMIIRYRHHSLKPEGNTCFPPRHNKVLLEGLFKCRLLFQGIDEQTSLHHAAALKQIKQSLDDTNGWAYHGTLQRLYEASVSSQRSDGKDQLMKNSNLSSTRSNDSEVNQVVDLTCTQEHVIHVPRRKDEMVDLTQDEIIPSGSTNNFYGPVYLETSLNTDSELLMRGTKRNLKTCVKGGELYVHADEVSQYLPKELCKAIKKHKSG